MLLCGCCGSETQGVPAMLEQAEFRAHTEGITWQQLLLHRARGVTGRKEWEKSKAYFPLSLRSKCYLWMDFEVIQNSKEKNVEWSQK